MTVCVRTRDRALQDSLIGAIRRLGHEAVNVDSPGCAADARGVTAAVVDEDLPGRDELLAALRGASPRMGLIVLTGRSDAASFASASELGADTVLRKPFELSELAQGLRAAAGAGACTPVPDFVAGDEGLAPVMTRLRRVAGTDLTVTIHGEGGTGRSLLARWLHALSPRREGPLVEVSALELEGERAHEWLCGAPSEPGRLGEAHRGTLVLDGVDRFPREAQEVLLSLFDETGPSLDARVVAIAGPDPLATALLEPLRRRLEVVRVDLPALRDRPRDVAALASHFLRRRAAEAGAEPARLDAAGEAALQGRPWRGNVVELENLMTRAALAFPGAIIDPGWFEGSLPTPAPAVTSGLNLRELERSAIVRSLQLSGGSRTAAARALGINVRTLRNKIQRYEIA